MTFKKIFENLFVEFFYRINNYSEEVFDEYIFEYFSKQV